MEKKQRERQEEEGRFLVCFRKSFRSRIKEIPRFLLKWRDIRQCMSRYIIIFFFKSRLVFSVAK